MHLTDEEAMAAGRAMFEQSREDLRSVFGDSVSLNGSDPIVGRGWAKLPGHIQRAWMDRARVAWRTVAAMRSGSSS